MQHLECPNLLETNTPETQRQGGVQKGRFYLSKGWIQAVDSRNVSPFPNHHFRVWSGEEQSFDSFLEG